MQNHFTIRPHLTIACLALLLGGCASEPVPVSEPMLSGDKMLSEHVRRIRDSNPP